jgi:hypothetical protein
VRSAGAHFFSDGALRFAQPLLECDDDDNPSSPGCGELELAELPSDPFTVRTSYL